MCLTVVASASFMTSWRSRTWYPSGTRPPIQIPLRLEAAILSRMRSPVTSRSNCANESKTFSVRRPIEVVVLNCWVTATNETPRAIEDFDHFGEVRQRAREPVHLVNYDCIDQPLVDIGHQSLQ